MARKYGKKKIMKTVGIIAVVAVLAVGAVAGLGALTNEPQEGFENVSVNYAIGGLDASGKYEETEASLYTKAGFDVENRETVYADVDFDTTITYQLYFYGEYDAFISATETLDGDHSASVPDGALTCRVEITPIWSEDTEEEDQKVTWLNKGGFADQLKLQVSEAVEAEEEA